MYKRRRRGYLTAILISFHEKSAYLWKIFSTSIKPIQLIELENPYNLHEAIINVIRPIIRGGVNTILIASTEKRLTNNFKTHINKRHKWVLDSIISLITIEGSANTPREALNLANSHILYDTIQKAAEKESATLIIEVEKHLLKNNFYTPSEFTAGIRNKESVDRLLVSESYYEDNKNNSNFKSAIQIASKNGVKVNILKEGTKANLKIIQLGGFIALKN